MQSEALKGNFKKRRSTNGKTGTNSWLKRESTPCWRWTARREKMECRKLKGSHWSKIRLPKRSTLLKASYQMQCSSCCFGFGMCKKWIKRWKIWISTLTRIRWGSWQVSRSGRDTASSLKSKMFSRKTAVLHFSLNYLINFIPISHRYIPILLYFIYLWLT